MTPHQRTAAHDTHRPVGPRGNMMMTIGYSDGNALYNAFTARVLP